MTAYASLLSLMRVIHDLETHPSPPISLDKQQLDSITQRITYFEEFLHSYISPPPVADDDEEEAADPLEMRIATAAHTAEDAIEYHIVDCIKHKKKFKKANGLKIKSITQCCGILQSVIEEMDSIYKVLMVVDTHEKKKTPLMEHDQVAMKNVTAYVVARSEALVGSDDALLEIMEKLAGGQLDCQVIPIVGMGGIGKTFLAKTIYAEPFVKERFDTCAWATISQTYHTREILFEILSQVTNKKKEEVSGKSADELGLELHKHLFSRRFLIVMDDMWSIDSWDNIQRFFPNNGNGSRVLVTTRLSQLSLQLNSNDYSMRMSFLDKASSWDLFSKTVFGDKSTSCPAELEEIGEEIVDNCRGLPLSIAVVGGLLKTMDDTRASWESIRDNFNSVVNMENDKHCLKLLKLSYNHLPVYLKPCFLYMGVFEEDENIRVSTLVQLWVSEGFLKPIKGEALETTARGFLQELIDRNLILIGELGSTGNLKFCKIHDLVRDMCLKEGQKQGFYHVVGKLCNPLQQGMNAQRRVVIPEDTWNENAHGDLSLMSHTRSLICEHAEVALCENLVLLRTFQAPDEFGISKDDFKQLDFVVFRYVNLRHLSIKVPWISSFFPSISHLWNLRTLVFSYSMLYSPTVVVDFWKMPQFRLIEFLDDCGRLPDLPRGDAEVVIMENLHTLKRLLDFKCTEAVVRRIPNIKRLELQYNKNEIHQNAYKNIAFDFDDGEDVYHLGNMKNMCGLESLSLCFLAVSPKTPVRKITFPHSLKKRKITFPHSLKKLYLSMNKFEWYNIMLEKISSLPLLEKLELSHGRFGKGKWEIAEGQFPCLKYLRLDMCRGLGSWEASEEDSSILPRLEHLKLLRLYDLKKIPFELGNIDTLKSIKLLDCREEAVKSVKEMFDEQVDLQGGEDQLSFQVVVEVRKNQQHLLSLAAPNFYVNLIN